VVCTRHVVERVLDLLRPHRLEQDFAKLRRFARLGELSRDEHHSNTRLQLPRMDGQLNAVEVRDHHVSEKRINVLLHKNAHRFWSASGHEDSEAGAFQYFSDGSPD
jgi:hypothetical protein